MNSSIPASKRRVWYALSFLIPFAICLSVLLILGIHPFGDKTLLIRDSNTQYIAFATYLKTVFTGENDLLYTFSMNLGGEMLSLLAYYLLSPFNLLFAFFGNENMPLAFTLVILLKMSLCGFTFFYASGKLYCVKPIHLAFSTAYALMAYTTIFGWNIIWLDGVMVLPLMGLGLKKLWTGESIWMYCGSLAYALLTNFYIGYMLCITSVMLSVCLFVMHQYRRKGSMAVLGRYVFASCVAGLSTSFIWLPSFLSVMSGRGQYTENIFTSGRFYNFNILGLAGKVLVGTSSPSQVSSGTPHIYCGIAAVFLVLMFLFLRRIPAQKKVLGIAVLGFLLVSFLFRIPNVIWHGFTQNSAFNFRYAFIFSYILLMIAQDTLPYCDDTDRKYSLLSGALIFLLILMVSAMKLLMNLEFVSLAGCAVSLVSLCLIIGFFMLNPQLRQRLWVGLLVCLLLETGANYGLSLKAVIGVDDTLYVSQYREYLNQVTPAVEYVREKDPGFFRMEKTFQRNHNDAMTFSYHGLSHFSSSQLGDVSRFMEKMGFCNCRDWWAYYNQGATGEVESFLGVSYVLSQQELSADKGYLLADRVNGIYVYENPNALPVAILADSSIMDVNMECADYFAIHNEIWNSIAVSDQNILTKVQPAVTLQNVNESTMEDGTILYSRIDPAVPASVVFEITVTGNHPLYCYFTAPDNQDARLTVNGMDHGEYFSIYRWDMANLGAYDAGDTVRVELVLTDAYLMLTDAYFYHENLDVLANRAQMVRENAVTVERLSSSRLMGEYESVTSKRLLFTIPYDSGWKLTVDGEPVTCERVLDLLFCAEVPSGRHSFELKYTPPGLTAGCMISAISLMAAVAYWYLLRRRTH